MYELQIRYKGSNGQWIYAGHRESSMTKLRDYADIGNADYRIVNAAGVVVWEQIR